MQKKRSGRGKLLFKDKSGAKGRRALLLLVVAATISLCGLLILLNNIQIRVNHVTIPISGMPKEYEGFTLIHISDLAGKRFGENQQTLLRTIQAQKSSVIVMTGDMVGGGDPEPFYELLDGLTDKKVIFIPGDADPDPIQPHMRSGAEQAAGTESIEVLAPYVVGAKERKAIYLDVPYVLPVGEKNLVFAYEYQLTLDVDAAISDLQNQIRSFSASEDNAETQAVRAYRLSNLIQLKALREKLAPDDMQIILRHYPLAQEYLADIRNGGNRPTLILAGHYVGGQWRIPILGAIQAPIPGASFGGWLPNQQNVSGLMTAGTVSQYITTGLGTSQTSPFPPFRLFNTPEVTVIQLTNFYDK